MWVLVVSKLSTSVLEFFKILIYRRVYEFSQYHYSFYRVSVSMVVLTETGDEVHSNNSMVVDGNYKYRYQSTKYGTSKIFSFLR